jgi:hypothetical protein
MDVPLGSEKEEEQQQSNAQILTIVSCEGDRTDVDAEEKEQQRNVHILTIVSCVQGKRNLLIWMLPWDLRMRSSSRGNTHIFTIVSSR